MVAGSEGRCQPRLDRGAVGVRARWSGPHTHAWRGIDRAGLPGFCAAPTPRLISPFVSPWCLRRFPTVCLGPVRLQRAVAVVALMHRAHISRTPRVPVGGHSPGVSSLRWLCAGRSTTTRARNGCRLPPRRDHRLATSMGPPWAPQSRLADMISDVRISLKTPSSVSGVAGTTRPR